MRRWALTALLLAAGCSQLAPPSRDDFYPFADLAITNPPLIDTLTFHWPREMLPVRVWVAANGVLAPYVDSALTRWQSAFLYGEFTATTVADSNVADIIVQNVIPATFSGIPARAPQCSGETNIDTATTAFTIQLPIHVYVWANGTIAGVPACFAITTTHEIGHAIGILAHSPDPGDVMFADPVFNGVSARDRETAEIAYHVPATMTAVGRR